ncbi:thiamine pyrophosphate-dependent enzyme [Kitasatospora viridis]|uniref:thiamine pyrophosphate-dependent enzyme n=1 Tax=Kitasatospora viridis TaxID=281105 RepID=UPI0014791314|nr:thiamine pyrophosphate-dependent enzyme [Kitasatospora viridis]
MAQPAGLPHRPPRLPGPTAALADPARPVTAVIGDGSLHYTLPALWTAAHERLPVTFIVVNNRGYGILRDFGARLGLRSVPGLDLPGIDILALARGYNVAATRVTSRSDHLAAALNAPAPQGPRLIEVVVPAPA